MICDILLTCLSMYSIPFLKYLQHWHHPVQSNFSRHLCMNHNMYSYLNTTPSRYSIFYSSSLLTLLGCPLLLLFPYKDFKDSRSFCSPDKAIMEYSGCKLKADELKKKPKTTPLFYFLMVWVIKHSENRPEVVVDFFCHIRSFNEKSTQFKKIL